MYRSPFGSLFSSDDSALKPKTEPASKSKASPSDDLGKRTAELKSSKIIAPNAKSIAKSVPEPYDLSNKKPYDRTTDEFKSFTTMESDDPRVIAEQSKILIVKNKQKLAALQRRLSEIKKKTKSAKIYRDVLIQYRQLPEKEKETFISWTLKHSSAIKKLNSARKLARIKKNTQEAIQSLDGEIKHWENLLKLKKEGVNIKGKTVLESYRPIEDNIKATPAETGDLPKFALKPLPKEEIYHLKSGKPFAKSSELGSLDATEEAINSLRNEARIKLESSSKKAAIKEGSYTQNFKAKLTGRDDHLKERSASDAPSKLRKKIERTIIRAKELNWQIRRLQGEIGDAQADYIKVQKNLSELTLAMSKDQRTTRVVHALGILIEARPESFIGSPTLLGAAKGAFSGLSQLGSNEPAEDTSPEKETEELLKQASDESTAGLKELETRQNALAKLKAEVEGKPAPPPIVLVFPPPIIISPPSQTKKTADTINKLLPWAAGLFLFMKLLEA